MRTNTAKQRALADQTAIGIMCNLASPIGAETLGQCGYDFVVIDLQHGENNLATVQVLMQTLSASASTPIVRVPANDPIHIQRVLDLGAYGVIVPFVNNAGEARSIVENTAYPPLGSRSFGPIRGTIYGGPDYFAKAGDELLVLPMIESADGLANAAAILAVDGIHGCFVGPADLNISLGHSPDAPLAAATEEGIAAILAQAAALGKVAGIHAFSIEDAKRRAEQGFRFITVMADTRLIRMGAQQTFAALRS
ncbi:4-hydroxy-2-oxoheptanedioate aldolase [Bosea sp. AK1]|uniref:HpcH/HpaI aldolase family protein n=1 Tax=unclassified Bosea (in: a-proteobacteria) TaxID=2653178 RepID=UPI0009EC2B24|nr:MULTISPECIES: aldolase/citrate lyase family protein [unclassified Bosea (in: a-proteobacteria)]TQI75361.1 4-hydroxy-2-oxoheptanedioate aldolase [Bosea sp. AK1]